MIKTFLKQSKIVFSSLFILFAGITIYIIISACADDGWWAEYTNITPEALVKDKAYTPFFFSGYSYYYDIYYDDGHDSRFSKSNVEQWNNYIGKDFSSELIDFYLNKVSETDAKKAVDYYNNKPKSNIILPNALLKYSQTINKKDKKQKEFFNYLILAKTCEKFAVNGDNYYDWVYNDKKRPVPNDVKEVSLEKEFIKGMKKSSSDFLKQRYWFQLIRYYFFNNQYDKTIETFEKNRDKFHTDEMFYRSMSYAAGAYYKAGKYSISNYYYSLVFAGNDKLKTVAHWSFHPQEESDWQETLNMCKNNKEKITLWQMLGIFYGDEIRSMKEIYNIDPSSDAMDILLARHLNIYESGLQYEDINENEIIISENLKWIKNVTDENKISNKFLWNIATGYFAFLGNDYTTSKKYYLLAEKFMPNDNLSKEQLRLLNTITKVGSLKSIKTQDEISILEDLKWLFSLTSSYEEKNPLRYSKAYDWLHNRIAQLYEKQGDYSKSECFVHKVELFGDKDKLAKFKEFMSKQNPSPYEALCQKESKVKPNDIWEYEAIISTFNEDLDDAIYKMEQAKNEVVLPGNPFNGKIMDCNDCDHEAPQKIKYTKLDFLKKMKLMKDNIESNNDIYSNALLLGNAYYNIAHFGNARAFYSCAVIEGGCHPHSLDSLFIKMLTNNKISVKYYKLALMNAKNDEQKAKCIYMLAKCERNQWYNENIFYIGRKYNYYSRNDSQPDFIEWKAFKLLKNYSHTKYYQEVLNECGYFKKVI